MFHGMCLNVQSRKCDYLPCWVLYFNGAYRRYPDYLTSEHNVYYFSTGHSEGLAAYKSGKLVIPQKIGQGVSSASSPARSLSCAYNVGLGTLESTFWTFLSACNLTRELAQSLENSQQLISLKLVGNSHLSTSFSMLHFRLHIQASTRVYVGSRECSSWVWIPENWC